MKKKQIPLAQLLAFAQAKYGIVFDHAIEGYLPDPELWQDFRLAADAQPGLITTTNGGIPYYLVNYLDPEIIEIAVAPMMAAVIAGEAKKGDWTTATAQFPVAERIGQTTAYGDWNNNGSTNSNYNWESRQSYYFQTISQWGQLELARAAEARLDHAAQINKASMLTIQKTQNAMGFFGVAGLQNYGLLNDPSLPPSITPADTGTGSSPLWANKTGDQVYADIQALYAQLVLQGNGTINKRMPMVLAMSNSSEANFTKTNSYGVNVPDLVKKNFPNLRIEAAPEYETEAGNLVQLFVETINATKTVQIGFTEKLRAHPVIPDLSGWRQKKSAGGWGAIWKQPYACASMLGV